MMHGDYSFGALTFAAALAIGGSACAARGANSASTSGSAATATATAAAKATATDVAATAPRADSLAIIAAATAFSAAYVRGDADSMAALYTQHAAIFPDGTPAIVGREPIRRYWTLPPNRRITRHVLMPDRVEIIGDVAHDYGRFEIAGETDGTPWGPSFGKYLVVWHRGEDGQWRMHLDMWNRGPQRGG